MRHSHSQPKLKNRLRLWTVDSILVLFNIHLSRNTIWVVDIKVESVEAWSMMTSGHDSSTHPAIDDGTFCSTQTLPKDCSELQPRNLAGFSFVGRKMFFPGISKLMIILMLVQGRSSGAPTFGGTVWEAIVLNYTPLERFDPLIAKSDRKLIVHYMEIHFVRSSKGRHQSTPCPLRWRYSITRAVKFQSYYSRSDASAIGWGFTIIRWQTKCIFCFISQAFTRC